MADNNITEETSEKWRNDPSNWRLGVFYYNKEDKRILPPKRNKHLGWTINFANPKSILVIVSISIVLVILIKSISRL